MQIYTTIHNKSEHAITIDNISIDAHSDKKFKGQIKDVKKLENYISHNIVSMYQSHKEEVELKNNSTKKLEKSHKTNTINSIESDININTETITSNE